MRYLVTGLDQSAVVFSFYIPVKSCRGNDNEMDHEIYRLTHVRMQGPLINGIFKA